MWRVIKQMGPAVFGVSIAQISLIINTIFASFLVGGQRVLAVLRGPADGVSHPGCWARRWAPSCCPRCPNAMPATIPCGIFQAAGLGAAPDIMLTLPAALALGMISVPLLATFFQHGAFAAHDVLMTRQALVGYSVGLIGMILVKILAPGFYARQDIKTPVKIGIVTLLATQAMNVLFVWLHLQHAGLALSIGLGACLNSAILFHYLRKHGIYQPEPGWVKFFVKLVLALAALALTLWFGMGSEQHWLTIHGWARILHLAALVVGGVVMYFAVLFALGFRLRDFAKRGA